MVASRRGGPIPGTSRHTPVMGCWPCSMEQPRPCAVPLACNRPHPAWDLAIRHAAHTGEVEVAGVEVRGVAVHEAPGSSGRRPAVRCSSSDATPGLATDAGFQLQDLCEHQLRGLSRRRRVSWIADRLGPTFVVPHRASWASVAVERVCPDPGATARVGRCARLSCAGVGVASRAAGGRRRRAGSSMPGESGSPPDDRNDRHVLTDSLGRHNLGLAQSETGVELSRESRGDHDLIAAGGSCDPRTAAAHPHRRRKWPPAMLGNGG